MVSESTRQYWLDTVLGWAEDRLAPPQFDECKRALLQGAPPDKAAIRAAELAQAERDAELCESQWYDAWNGELKDASSFLSNTAGNAYAAAIREAANEPSRNPVS